MEEGECVGATERVATEGVAVDENEECAETDAAAEGDLRELDVTSDKRGERDVLGDDDAEREFEAQPELLSVMFSDTVVVARDETRALTLNETEAVELRDGAEERDKLRVGAALCDTEEELQGDRLSEEESDGDRDAEGVLVLDTEAVPVRDARGDDEGRDDKEGRSVTTVGVTERDTSAV